MKYAGGLKWLKTHLPGSNITPSLYNSWKMATEADGAVSVDSVLAIEILDAKFGKGWIEAALIYINLLCSRR